MSACSPGPSMPPGIVLYSDCPVFGGSEFLVAQLLSDVGIGEEFSPHLVYRKTSRYEAGLRRRVPPGAPRTAVSFPERDEWLEALFKRVPRRSAQLPFKLLFRLADMALFPVEIVWLRHVFRQLKPALVHIHSGGYPGALGCRAAAVAARLAGAKRVVFTFNNIARPVRLPWDVFDVFIDRLVAHACDVFVTASKAAEAAFVARGFSPGRVRRILNGVSSAGGTRDAGEVRREFGLGPALTVVVLTAFFERRKGHRVLLAALDLLSKEPGFLREAAFILVGDGPELESVRHEAAALSLPCPVLFPGYRSDARDILAAADAMVLPSIAGEDMPLAVLDAMALGKPVVASSLSGIPEQIEHGRTGLLVPPGDASGLSQALKRLLSDPGERRSMGRAGLERFKEYFTAEKAVSRYKELYRGLLTQEERVHAQASAG
ncbi:MAG: glycosyltransferase family 4 protein [Elusimicrobiota bacterium]